MSAMINREKVSLQEAQTILEMANKAPNGRVVMRDCKSTGYRPLDTVEALMLGVCPTREAVAMAIRNRQNLTYSTVTHMFHVGARPSSGTSKGEMIDISKHRFRADQIVEQFEKWVGPNMLSVKATSALAFRDLDGIRLVNGDLMLPLMNGQVFKIAVTDVTPTVTVNTVNPVKDNKTSK